MLNNLFLGILPKIYTQNKKSDFQIIGSEGFKATAEQDSKYKPIKRYWGEKEKNGSYLGGQLCNKGQNGCIQATVKDRTAKIKGLLPNKVLRFHWTVIKFVCYGIDKNINV